MVDILILLFVQSAVGVFGALYNHKLLWSLGVRIPSRSESRIYASRSVVLSFLLMLLAWFQLNGWFVVVLAFLLIAFASLLFMAVIVEVRAAFASAVEYVLSFSLLVNCGFICALLLPNMVFWFDFPATINFYPHGWGSVVLSAFSVFWLYIGGKYFFLPLRFLVPPLSLSGFTFSGSKKMRVLITGGTGFIGKRLVSVLIANGHSVTVLTRNVRAESSRPPGGIRYVSELAQLTDDTAIDAIINFAGEPLAGGRWNEIRKQRFIQSRVELTSELCDLVGRLTSKPEVMISGSAIGFYGPQSDEFITEGDEAVDCFSHKLCRLWEQEGLSMEAFGVRVCLLRIGIVLGEDGGPLAELRLPFELGVSMQIGSGKQWMSWIHRDDLIAMTLYIMNHSSLSGPVNGTAPTPVTNAEFSDMLGAKLKTYFRIVVPSKILSLLVGEMADEVLITGQRVIPDKVLQKGFKFTYPDLPSALEHLII